MNSPAPLPFWWVEPVVVAAGVIVSLVALLITVHENRKIARLKTTIDLIEQAESDVYYKNLYQNFRRFRMDTTYRDGVLEPKNETDWENRFACFSYLNHYELIAISFKRDVLDETFYRDWMGYAVLRDFRDAKGLTDIARSPKKLGDPGDKVAYCNLEVLCDRWRKTMP